MSVDVASENANVENREFWDQILVGGFGDIEVAGFVRQISVNIGETIEFSVDGSSTLIDIYRVGWYDGAGYRRIAQIVNTPAEQPEASLISDSNGATTCDAWSITASWAVPIDAVSGLYLALIRTPPESPAAPDAFYATFVVRDDSAEADIIYKTSDSTWHGAYNHYGTPSDINGSNVYGSNTAIGSIVDRSFCVDYRRPVITRQGVPQTFWQACELPLIRFLERCGYRVKYISCVDLDRIDGVLNTGKVFVSSGHDEYWTLNMRRAVETWRDGRAGRSIFMSGNEVFWKAEYEYYGENGVRMWCRKDTMPGPNSHMSGVPFVDGEWQGTWKDTRWVENEPEWLLTGTDFRMNGVFDHEIIVPKNPYGGHVVWGGTSLNDADITFLGALGFEADSVRATQPTDSVRMLAAYSRNIDGAYADNNGETYNNDGVLNWGVVSQRYSGGGLTIGFGTCQWSWLLDDVHLRGTGDEVSLDAQQFVVNLLNDLGAAPQTLPLFLNLFPMNELDAYGLDPEPVNDFVSNAYLGNGSPARIMLGSDAVLQVVFY